MRSRSNAPILSALPLLSLTAALIVGGCGDSEPTPEESLERSCGGETVPNCRPYEYSVVREATVMPAEIEVGDPLARVQVRVVFDGCADAPSSHIISLRAIDEAGGMSPDGGPSGSIYPLATVQDGSSEDMDDQVGVIAADLENFFIAPIPARAELVIRVEPRIDVCRGSLVDLPYRTGAMFEAP